MRDLIAGRRQGSLGVVLGLTAVFCLLASSLGLTLAYRAQVQGFKRDFYTQCQARLAYDASSQRTRAASRAYYQHQAEIEQANPFIDDQLRRQRVADARAMVNALDDTLSRTVPGGCSRYKP